MTEIVSIRGFWFEEVKPIAAKCAKGYDRLLQAENSGDEATMQTLVDELAKEGESRDMVSVWYIGQMISQVEYALLHDRNPMLGLLQAHGTLNSEEFYQNVFDGEESEETRNYRTLGQKLTEMMSM